jgi:hypothetical protein
MRVKIRLLLWLFNATENNSAVRADISVFECGKFAT